MFEKLLVSKMSVDQGNISKILSILSHPIRREILLILSLEHNESSFTDLLNLLKIDTGKLSFHLRSLSPFIEQNSNGKYKLSRAGENAVRIICDIESWAEVANIHAKASGLPLASFKNRAIAFIVDFAFMLAITMAITYIPDILSLSTSALLGAKISDILFITIGLHWLYSTLLEGFNGQTIGKRLLALKVVRTDGKKMFYDHAAVRNFGKVLPLLPFDLIEAWQTKHNDFMRYFDKFAGTTVIDLHFNPNNAPSKLKITS